MAWELRGKTALVTGATSGIGLEASVELARGGARLVMVGRDPSRTEAAVADVIRRSGSREVSHLLCDFSSQTAIRALAAAGRGSRSAPCPGGQRRRGEPEAAAHGGRDLFQARTKKTGLSASAPAVRATRGCPSHAKPISFQNLWKERKHREHSPALGKSEADFSTVVVSIPAAGAAPTCRRDIGCRALPCQLTANTRSSWSL